MTITPDKLAARLLSNANIHIRDNAPFGQRLALDARQVAVLHAVAQELAPVLSTLETVKSKLHRLTTAGDSE